MEQINDLSEIETIISEYEKPLSWKRGGEVKDRLHHVLSQYRQMADNSVYKMKHFAEDVKTQFKALEIITEGLTDELNHGQKRTIANHMIRMMRTMVDRMSQLEFDYTTQTYERFNFFRSETPERKLHEERANLSRLNKEQTKLIDSLKEKHPEIFKELQDDIPF